MACGYALDAKCRVHFALTAIAAASLAIWLYLAFFRGFFWRLRAADDDVARHQSISSWPPVIAVVPARNEAATIRQSLTSLLRQDYAGEFSVRIVDDHSEDGTAEIAEQTARELKAEYRVTIGCAAALPSGWTGKLWALNEGARQGEGVPAYYWFTDADVAHAPDTLGRLVSRAERGHLDLTSLMVLLRAGTTAERGLIPAFLFFFLKLYPPRWIANPKMSTAGAAGGCILLRCEALHRIGGLATIGSEVIDDCALARAVKRSGGRIWMGVTRASASLRSYGSFREVRDLIARTAFTQLRYSPVLLLATLAGMLVVYVAPVALLLSQNLATRVLALASWLLMSLVFVPTVRFYGLSALWAPFLPLAAAFYSYATALSAARYYFGRGAQWKGRTQAFRG